MNGQPGNTTSPAGPADSSCTPQSSTVLAFPLDAALPQPADAACSAAAQAPLCSCSRSRAAAYSAVARASMLSILTSSSGLSVLGCVFTCRQGRQGRQAGQGRAGSSRCQSPLWQLLCAHKPLAAGSHRWQRRQGGACSVPGTGRSLWRDGICSVVHAQTTHSPSQWTARHPCP
jgi:hypothetical protein